MYHQAAKAWQTLAMKTRIACLPPGQLTPGMTLAAPILSAQGRVLLAAEASLDETVLENLRRRGIEYATVAMPDPRDPETIAREQQAAAERVNFIFRGTRSAARETLRATLLDYRARQLA